MKRTPSLSLPSLHCNSFLFIPSMLHYCHNPLLIAHHSFFNPSLLSLSSIILLIPIPYSSTSLSNLPRSLFPPFLFLYLLTNPCSAFFLLHSSSSLLIPSNLPVNSDALALLVLNWCSKYLGSQKNSPAAPIRAKKSAKARNTTTLLLRILPMATRSSVIGGGGIR